MMVWIVTSFQGSYDDGFTKVEECFDSKESAEQYCLEQNAASKQVGEKEYCLDVMLDHWKGKNPDDGTSAWNESANLEKNRVMKLLGLDYQYSDPKRFSITEKEVRG